MACTEQELLFYTSEYGGSLYTYRFLEEKTTELSQDYHVTGMKAHGDDIFVNVREKDPAKNTCELLYAAKKGEQIAGFSMEENTVYLQRKSGVYVHDLDTGRERLLAEDPNSREKYGTMIFAYENDKIYIFSQAFGVDSPVLPVVQGK